MSQLHRYQSVDALQEYVLALHLLVSNTPTDSLLRKPCPQQLLLPIRTFRANSPTQLGNNKCTVPLGHRHDHITADGGQERRGKR